MTAPPPAVNKASFPSTSSPTFVVRFIDDGHSDWGEVSESSYELRFCDGWDTDIDSFVCVDGLTAEEWG